MSENPVSNTPMSDSKVSGLYKDWFLDYASYVILERAVPALKDGMKPFNAGYFMMKTMDDGRLPQGGQHHRSNHAIPSTWGCSDWRRLVNLGQKDLLIDCQGNWGDVVLAIHLLRHDTSKRDWPSLLLMYYSMAIRRIGNYHTTEEKRTHSSTCQVPFTTCPRSGWNCSRTFH